MEQTSLEELELQHILDRNRYEPRDNTGLCLKAASICLPQPPAARAKVWPACSAGRRGALKQVACKAGREWLSPAAATEQGTEQVRLGLGLVPNAVLSGVLPSVLAP